MELQIMIFANVSFEKHSYSFNIYLLQLFPFPYVCRGGKTGEIPCREILVIKVGEIGTKCEGIR